MFHLVLSCCTAVGSIWLIKKFITWYSIHRKIKRKQKDVNIRTTDLFHKFQGMEIPFVNKERICHLSGSEIHAKIAAEELSAVDVLEAFQANAIMENSKFNFLADIIYEADVSALMIDPTNNSPIMGLPLGISDSLCIQKYDSTLGLLRNSFHPSTTDSPIITVLRDLGAIPTIITNIGQCDIAVSTSNPIFGTTLNPRNTEKSCGGSGGGLAVALATDSCVIGVANDLHGNMRVPAAFCGVFALKPHSARIAKDQTKTVGPQQNILKNAIGPMARNIDDLIALFRAMVSHSTPKLDRYCVATPFNEVIFTSSTPLRIGCYVGLGGRHLQPVPSTERAVQLAKAALQRAGHTVVEYRLPDCVCSAGKIHTEIIFSDGGTALREAMKNEPIDANLRWLFRLVALPKPLKRLLAVVGGWFCVTGGDLLAALVGAPSVYAVWQLRQRLDEFREEVLTSWEGERLDGLICPVAPIVAPTIKVGDCVMRENAYAVLYNVLDYAAGVVPVTRVTEEDEQLRGCGRGTDCQKGSVGLPVGVQCVALPWQEEVALRIMKDVVDNL